ncbi:hypothetical protein HK405_001710, partial [Cladochytrium tenue]
RPDIISTSTAAAIATVATSHPTPSHRDTIASILARAARAQASLLQREALRALAARDRLLRELDAVTTVFLRRDGRFAVAYERARQRGHGCGRLLLSRADPGAAPPRVVAGLNGDVFKEFSRDVHERLVLAPAVELLGSPE